MATERIMIAIEAKNAASAALKQVQTDLKGLDSAAKTASQGLSGLAGAVGVGGIAAAVGAVTAQILELAEAGAQVERVATAFEGLASAAGQSSAEMLSALQAASRGTIAASDLMLTANRAMLLGVADSSEEMAALMEVASVRAKAMGLTTTQAFNDIVTGIGRMSPLILDNLGIMTGGEQVYEDYAAAIGKSADALTDAERKQALVNTVIEGSASLVAQQGDAVDDAATKMERYTAAIKDAREELGRALAPSVGDIANVAAAGVDVATALAVGKIIDQYRLLAGELELAQKALAAIGQTGTSAYLNLTERIMAARAQILLLDDAFLNTTRAEDMMAQGARGAAAATQELTLKTLSADEAYLRLYSSVMSARAALDTIADTAAATARSIALGAAHAIGAADAYSLYGELTDDLIEYSETLRIAGFEEEKIAFLVAARGDAMARQYTKMYETTRATAKEIPKISEEYQKLQSTIESVLGSVLDLSDIGAGDIIEQALGRQDAVNEAARRLADVAVLGWESPWAEYFRSEFPALWAEAFAGTEAGGDIQKQAAEILRQFEQGLRPELIDRELVKERVRAMLIGDANMAELAKEIATELATELNIPLYEALSKAQGVLGVAGGEAMRGAELGDVGAGAVAQIEESQAGVQVVDAFVNQMRGVFARIEQAGKDAGAVWGRGFQATVEAGVPPGLIDMLVNLVTPGVAAGLARQQSMQGAQ